MCSSSLRDQRFPRGSSRKGNTARIRKLLLSRSWGFRSVPSSLSEDKQKFPRGSSRKGQTAQIRELLLRRSSGCRSLCCSGLRKQKKTSPRCSCRNKPKSTDQITLSQKVLELQKCVFIFSQRNKHSNPRGSCRKKKKSRDQITLAEKVLGLQNVFSFLTETKKTLPGEVAAKAKEHRSENSRQFLKDPHSRCYGDHHRLLKDNIRIPIHL